MTDVGTGVGLSGEQALDLQFCQERICTGQNWFPGASEKGRSCWMAVNDSWRTKNADGCLQYKDGEGLVIFNFIKDVFPLHLSSDSRRC